MISNYKKFVFIIIFLIFSFLFIMQLQNNIMFSLENQKALILTDKMSEEEILKRLLQKNIAIFSATLNPPTIAHEDMLEHLLAMKNNDGSPRFDYVYIHVTIVNP